MTDKTPDQRDTEAAKRLLDRVDASTLMAMLALVVSFAALIVSIYETRVMEAQNEAAVWPYIMVAPRYSAQGFDVNITNKGVGPAIVKTVQVSVDGEPHASALSLLEHINGEEKLSFGWDILRSNNPAGSVMSPDENATIMGLPWRDDTRVIVDKMANFTISIDVCYCSIFESCWRTNLNTQPTPVKMCMAAEG